MKKTYKATQAFYSFLAFFLMFSFYQSGLAQSTEAKEFFKQRALNRTSLIPKERVLSESKFFQGDTLYGFSLEAEIDNTARAYGDYSEFQVVLFKKEVEFVKKKYNIKKLPFEITQENQKSPYIPPHVANAACTNIGFDDSNDFAAWVGYEGHNTNSNNALNLTGGTGPLSPPTPVVFNPATTSCNYFSLVNTGTDLYTGVSLVSPLGGYAARLGGIYRNMGGTAANNPGTCSPTPSNSSNNTAGEVLETTFIITNQNCLFQYAFLFMYMDDSSHAVGTQPYFKTEVIDNTTGGDTIPCLNYYQQGLAGVAPGGYSKIDEGQSLNLGLNGTTYPESYLYYTPNWVQNSLNLKPYIGHSLTVKFTVTGCTLTAHPGYAYVDAKCGPLALIIPSLACQGGTASLIAPPQSGGTFTWNGPTILTGAGTDSITTNQSGTYSVTIQERPGCSYMLDTTIAFYPNPTVSVNSATLCTGITGTLNVVSTGGAGALNYVWSTTTGLTFTSGDTVASANPAATTIYTVTGTSAYGCKDTAVANVIVNVEPPPTFTAPAVCLGSPTIFSNTVVAGDSYSWNFGDSHTLADTADIANPSYTYTYSGNFAVSFSVTTAGGCKSNVTQTVTVNQMPVIHFTANHPCDGSAVNFTNTTPSQGSFSAWHWDFNDGDTSNLASPPAYTYTAPAGFSAAGCYSVVLTGTTTTGCAGSFDTIVYVHNNPFAYFNAFEACLGDASKFVDSSFVQNPSCLNDQITTWNYDFGDGQIITYNSSTMPDTIKHTYISCGAYNITATVTTNNSCTYTNTIIGDTVFCLPVVTGPLDFSVCPGGATPVQDFNTTCANGGTPFAEWFQSLTNVNNTGAPPSFLNPGGIDQVPSYGAIAQNMSCNLLKDSVFAVAVSGVGCVGNAVYYVANVFPTPVLSHMDSIKVCANQQVTVPAFVACPATATTAWVNSQTSIGLAASDTGNITSFTGLNTTASVVDALVTVTPTANGCPGPDSTFNIMISPLPQIVISSDTVCPGSTIPPPTIVTTPTTNVTYVWTVTNNTAVGMPASGSGVPGSYTAPANGTFVNQSGIITYTPSLNGCLGSAATATVTVRPTPVVTPMPNEFYCPNDVVPQINFTCNPASGTPIFSYSGIGGIGITQIGSIQSFTATNPSSLPIVSTVSVNATLNGCPGPNTTFSITVFPNPVANFNYTPECEGVKVPFTDESTVGGGISIATWQWDMNNDGFIDITGQNIPPYSITPAGTHSVTLLVTTNSVPSCSAQTTEPVIIYPNPKGDFVGVDLKGCTPVNTAFTYRAGADTVQIAYWNWNFGNGQSFGAASPGGQFPKSQNYTNASPTTPVYYSTSLIVTSDNGCKDTIIKSNYIEVYPKPIPGFSWGPKDADLYEPSINFVNQAIGASTYTPTLTYGQYGVEYYLSDNYLSGTESNYMYNNTSFTHGYNNPDYVDVEEQYPVTQWVINSYGCTDSITEIVTIQPIVTFYIPNAFSPNGDGINEGFKGTGIGIKDNTYNLWIFDRWGLMIYHADGLEKPWDGHMQGHEGQAMLQEDVYVWKVKFDDILGKEHDYHGTVTLIR